MGENGFDIVLRITVTESEELIKSLQIRHELQRRTTEVALSNVLGSAFQKGYRQMVLFPDLQQDTQPQQNLSKEDLMKASELLMNHKQQIKGR